MLTLTNFFIFLFSTFEASFEVSQGSYSNKCVEHCRPRSLSGLRAESWRNGVASVRKVKPYLHYDIYSYRQAITKCIPLTWVKSYFTDTPSEPEHRHSVCRKWRHCRILRGVGASGANVCTKYLQLQR
jgi:hypothetical protein